MGARGAKIPFYNHANIIARFVEKTQGFFILI